MATTREQAEAYGYDHRRRVTGLLRGADEAQHDPRRRLNRALGGGAAVGVLIMAGFGIAGFLGGGRGPALPSAGAVVVGDDGDRYVVADTVVHPALNLASALLVGGGQVTEVRQSVLDAAPRGLPVGIPGAPDALPGRDALVDDAWTLCSVPSESGGAPADTALYVSVPGVAPADGEGDGATVLVRAEDDTLWLLTEGRRYALSEHVRDILELRRTQPVELPTEIIATLPEGPELTVPEEPAGAGSAPTAALPLDARVGDLAHTASGGAPQFYAVRPDGLVPVSELVHTLLLPGAGTDHVLTAADAARAPRSEEPAPGDRAWPDARPRAEAPARNQPVCVSTLPGAEPGDAPWQATVHLPRTIPEPSQVTPVTTGTGDRLGLLDRVYVPPGSGAVVRATTSAAAGGTYTLVTDSGTAYPFASPDAVQRLRYDPEQAPSVPKSFAGLLPTGPVLDPNAAAREHRGGGVTGDSGAGGDSADIGADGSVQAGDAAGTGDGDE
ncbi:type VII secretion protein EccB [Streptomyces lonarensis]|uniref:Type VII secretion protein EccB n=1 Tax=Streptomyces lonarensis TaxID=700599 RepID=A0A7X6I0Z0_9ACTN|nr:type VII secretion protein EccB [Streptomyces lonarensis]NJQ08221.1 type VII secretion protein EccB [Streptomyces lonarensis]